MITDRRVFDDDYLPRSLLHREGAVEALSRAFDSALSGAPATNVLISGPSGVGKTVLARHTLARLEEHAVIDQAHIHSVGQTTAGVLRAALRQSSTPVDVASNTPVEELRARLHEVVDRPYILILDEADGLPETDVIETVLDVPLVSIVAICHDPRRWLAHVGVDLRRAIGEHIRLDRYGTTGLADILEMRADRGLADVVEREQLEWIADEAAGVARYGIQSLRAAAELASERGHTRIRDEDVADAFERARREIRRANLRSLPYHHQVLYAIIHAAGDISAGELHRQYDQLAEALYRGRARTPIGERSRRNKLAKLREYDLIEYAGASQGRVYAVRDGSVGPSIDLDSIRD